MKKVVVFDDGEGCNLIGDYIEQELPVEVIRVTDRANAPYEEKSRQEIRELTEMALLPYIGKVDVIVLADADVTLVAGEYLIKKYPEQIFMGYGARMHEAMQKCIRAMSLTSGVTRVTEQYQMMKAQCKSEEVFEPDCSQWSKMIVDGKMTDEVLGEQIKEFPGGMILIYATDFIELEDALRRIFGWRVSIVDLRPKLLRELSIALGMKVKVPLSYDYGV